MKALSSFIVGAAYDRIFFIFSPLLALALGAALSFTPLAAENHTLNGRSESWVSLFSGVFTMAHLVIVFFRSHGNRSVFATYPKRFVWGPVVLFGAMVLSSWALVFFFVLAVWWDAYHSALQTFGLGRMYDLRAGRLSEAGRSLDRGLNLVLYVGPILGGAVLMDHVRHFDKFGEVGSAFFTVIPAAAEAHHRWLTAAAIAGGGTFIAFYLLRVRALVRAGEKISPHKIALFVSTAACSIWAWGFNSFGQAFFIMNFFHALQYFALVWHVEKERIRFLPVLLAVGFGYGLWAKFLGESSHVAMSLLLTVSILHFWYDGFIWSVRKQEEVRAC